MAIIFKEQFTGLCRHCDKSVLGDAEFCHHCGKLLRTDISEEAASEKAKIKPERVSALLKETRDLFLIWYCCITFIFASALIDFFYHKTTPIIIASVCFVYVWIFLIAKMDQLAIAIRHTPKQIAYLSLLLPIIGTIICYQKIDRAARSSI